LDVQHTIARIIEQLRPIEGVQAIVLGGSRARGTGHEHSDIDIGIYYDGNAGLDIEGIRLAAAVLDDERRGDIITGIGGWGPWINGGGWLAIDGLPVDLLYRDLRKVSKVVEQCLAGDITIDYQPGHPHGFVNAVYAAEAALCQALWDPNGRIGEIKARMQPYPAAMREGMLGKFLWEANFSLAGARKGTRMQDLSYIAGHCFRAISCINQALFALNDTFWMNEKGAAAIADTFSMVPPSYASRVNEVISLITEDRPDTDRALERLQAIIEETNALIHAGGGKL
jgi:hypothetical protein